MKTTLLLKNETHTLNIKKLGATYQVNINGTEFVIKNGILKNDVFHFELDGERYKVKINRDGKENFWASINGQIVEIEQQRSVRNRSGGMVSGGKLIAPMPGQVIEILNFAGDEVEVGQPILILEAMKMEIKIVSPIDGVVNEIMVEKGQQVDKNQNLGEISPID
jgi:3-methylcrotonyl-CoA carboxylase alpha subunit